MIIFGVSPFIVIVSLFIIGVSLFIDVIAF